ncbi:MAG: hypothetical protein WAL71_19360 [Terriglobales bacterium]|jgi:uncharacterized membrane protein (DUF2068 family)
MRPLGVTLIGFYQILRGLISALFGLSILAFTGLATKLASLAAEGNAMQRLLSSFGHIAGLIILGAAVLHIAAGYGILQMENWGRFLTLLFSAVGLAILLPFLHGILPMAFALINGASVIYLVLPSTKRAFQYHDRDKPLRMAA